MTRFTTGQLRQAVGSDTYRHGPSTINFPVYPTNSLQKAVRTYHFGGGEAEATRDLDIVLRRSWSDSPSKLGKARTARAQFQNYVRMDQHDGRSPYSPVEVDLTIGRYEVGARVDVALLDPAGYAGRFVVWTGTSAPDRRAARLLCCMTVLALDAAMGAGRTQSAELWHPRTNSIHTVDAGAARGAASELGRVLRRAAGD